jgi:Holliday junction DNA helicase RuvB
MVSEEIEQPVLESILRPKTLKDYIGQGKAKNALKLFVDAGKSRGSVAEHILLYGPPGMGKTTLSRIMAAELNGELKVTSGPAIEKTGDLAAILTNLKDNDILFIDEIHRLPKPVEEALYPVMEEFALDIVIGKGPAARTLRLSIPRITIIGATTRIALLSPPMRDRFGLVLRLDNYIEKEMELIVKRSAQLLELPISNEVIVEISKRARNTPRIANRILKRLRDLHEVNKYKNIEHKHILELFSILDIDEHGLDHMDKKYMNIIIEKFDGGPVGLSTLATALSEDKQTLEEYTEPYLIQKGFIKKTSRGRIVTDKGYQVLKLVPPRSILEQEKLL